MVRGSDAIGEHLPIRFEQRQLNGEKYAGARHPLPFKGVPMNIHNARQKDQVAEIPIAWSMVFGDQGDLLVGEFNRPRSELSLDQYALTAQNHKG